MDVVIGLSHVLLYLQLPNLLDEMMSFSPQNGFFKHIAILSNAVCSDFVFSRNQYPLPTTVILIRRSKENLPFPRHNIEMCPFQVTSFSYWLNKSDSTNCNLIVTHQIVSLSTAFFLQMQTSQILRRLLYTKKY